MHLRSFNLPCILKETAFLTDSIFSDQAVQATFFSRMAKAQIPILITKWFALLTPTEEVYLVSHTFDACSIQLNDTQQRGLEMGARNAGCKIRRYTPYTCV